MCKFKVHGISPEVAAEPDGNIVWSRWRKICQSLSVSVLSEVTTWARSVFYSRTEVFLEQNRDIVILQQAWCQSLNVRKGREDSEYSQIWGSKRYWSVLANLKLRIQTTNECQ